MKPAQRTASFVREVVLGLFVVAFGLAAWGCASSGSTTLAVTPSSVLTGSMASARANHTATLLNNGKVLIAGGAGDRGPLASAELYDSATKTFTPTGSMRTARYSHTATLLNNGRVLIAGGVNSSGSTLASAELYDPAAGTFTPTGSLATARALQTASRLNNGLVLFAGGSGSNGSILASAELYDSTTGAFTPAGSMASARTIHTATRLNNGLVLLAGGSGSSGSALASAELYDSATGAFTPAGSMATARTFHTATLLNGGMVLLAGGFTSSNGSALASAERYDPATGAFIPTGNMSAARGEHMATLLTNGTVLVAGGKASGVVLASEELYDSASGIFAATVSMKAARDPATATLLTIGTVLIAGGNSGSSTISAAELYQPVTVTLPGLVSIAVSPQGSEIGFLPAGETAFFMATGTFSDGSRRTLASVTWSSSSGVVTISNGDGGVGVAFASLCTNCGPFVPPVTITASVGSVSGSTDVIWAPVFSMEAVDSYSFIVGIFNPFYGTNPVGFTFQEGVRVVSDFIPTTDFLFTTVAIWNSSAPKVATISPTGRLTIVGPGSTTIKAVIGAFSATGTVTVKTVASLAVTPANPSIPFAPGATQQFAATVTYGDGSTANVGSVAGWASSAPGVATISSSFFALDRGLATFAGPGSTTITAFYGPASGSTTLTLTAAAPTLVSIAVTPANPSIALGATQQFTATGTYSDSSIQNLTNLAAWTSSATGVATISTTGLATSAGPGPTTIQAAVGTVKGTTTLTVTSAAAAPVLTSLLPANAMAGGASFSLTVNGSNFTAASTVIWNGSSRGTTFVSSTQLTAFITTPDIATAGMAQVTVSNPAPAGASAAFPFSVIGTLLRVSVASDGTEANSGGHSSVTSGNGRYVAFTSEATNLVTGDTNGTPDIFLADICTGAPAGCTFSVTRVSVANDSTQANGFNQYATMSADGRFVTFVSTATNLVPGITRLGEIYVRDTCTGGPAGCVPSTVLVTAAPNGAAGNGVQQTGGAISGDGRYVAFSTTSSNLIPSNATVLVRDTCFGAPAGCAPSTIAASVATDGTPGVGVGELPAMSADGRYVAFDYAGSGDTLGTGPSTSIYEVYLRDTCLSAPAGCTPSTSRVSVADGGGANNGGYNVEPAVSADGRYVAFISDASNLVTGDTNNVQDVFVRDTCIGAPNGCTPSTTRVSVASDGTQGNNNSAVTGISPLVISANGRFVAFDSVASNLVPNDTNNSNTDIFVRDTCAGAPLGCTPSTVSVSGAGDSSPDPNSSEPSLSADGQFVTFSSLANNLVSGDTNVTTDVFLAAGFAPSASSVPTPTSLSPSNVLAGAAGFDVEIDGSGFVPSSVARWNGANRVTIFVSSTKLLIRVLASDMSPSGVANVTVFSPAPGGGTSTSLPFTLN